MPETQDTTPADDTAPPATSANTSTSDDQTDWQDKFAGQRKVNRDLERKLRATQEQLEEARKPKPDGEAPDLDALRAQVESEVMARANQTILRAEIKAAAAGKLADPADALALIDLSALDVSADGSVDTEELSAAIADLIKNKPYLAAQGGRVAAHGSGDGGVRHRNPQDLDTRIEAATKARDFHRVIALKRLRHAQTNTR